MRGMHVPARRASCSLPCNHVPVLLHPPSIIGLGKIENRREREASPVRFPSPCLPPLLPLAPPPSPLRQQTSGGRPATSPSPTTMSASFPAPPSPSPTASHTTKHAAGRRGCRPAPCKIMQGTDGVRSVRDGAGGGGQAGVSSSPLQDRAGNRWGERGVPSAREGKMV